MSVYSEYPQMQNEFEAGLNGKKSRKAAKKAKRQARKAKRKEKRKTKGGFFKRVWRGIKRFNPATAAMRNGLLAALKVDLKKMSSRLRYAYLTAEQAAAMGVSAEKHARIKKTLSKLEKKFYALGGKTKNVKNAILKGRGNRDKKVPLNGLEGIDSAIRIPFLSSKEQQSLESALDTQTILFGHLDDEQLLRYEPSHEPSEPTDEPSTALGEVATATVIAAATPVIVALINMMNKSGVPTEEAMYDESGLDTDYNFEEEGFDE